MTKNLKIHFVGEKKAEEKSEVPQKIRKPRVKKEVEKPIIHYKKKSGDESYTEEIIPIPVSVPSNTEVLVNQLQQQVIQLLHAQTEMQERMVKLEFSHGEEIPWNDFLTVAKKLASSKHRWSDPGCKNPDKELTYGVIAFLDKKMKGN